MNYSTKDTSRLTLDIAPSLPTLLTVLFVALKLTHVISWSWLWVLAPIWISLGVALVLIIILAIFLVSQD